MNNSAMLRLQLNEALDWLDDVVRDVTREQYALSAIQMAIHTGDISAAKGMQGLQGPVILG